MTGLEIFDYSGQQVRTVAIDGEPWFVAADVAGILGYRDAFNLTRRLDDDERGTHSLSTPSGDQGMTVISESGLYVAVLGSQIAGAKEFKRWVTHQVLPQLRRTGSYGNFQLDPFNNPDHVKLLIQAGHAALVELEGAKATIAELEPKAMVADKLLDAAGDLSVGDAAKALTRAGVKTGEARLFGLLKDLAWTYRSPGDGRWRVYQRVIEQGLMSVLPMSHYHPKTGVLVLDAPQPRVTPKGLQKLLTMHGSDLVPA